MVEEIYKEKLKENLYETGPRLTKIDESSGVRGVNAEYHYSRLYGKPG